MKKRPIKLGCVMGLSFHGRFRDAVERLLEAGNDWFSTPDLQELVRALSPPSRSKTLTSAMEDGEEGDVIHFETLQFQRTEYGWRVSKEWDVSESMEKCDALAKEVCTLTGKDHVALDDEFDRQRLWDVWQNSHTRSIQSDPDWHEYWKPEDFPLEHYNAEKAAKVCRILAEQFGPEPRCTKELVFWFMRIAEGLP
jgi:CRISPR/Cas system-associated endonuclease/helicase Cas3